MTKNLSKQLCELCGIKPVIEDSCKISDRYWKNSHKIKGIHDDYVQRYCPYDMECTAECEYFYEKQIYPDFTKPENFVRLLEILSNYMYDDDRGISITKNTVILGDPICLKTDESEKGLNIRQKVLKLLLDGFQEGFENDKKLKQSIREAEWCMTNHIEELMKAAGVEKQYYSFNSTDGNTYNWELNENGNKKYKKIFIGEPELKERTLTPAKQLELIKLILKKPYIEWEQYFENNKFILKADMPDETYACLTIDVENTEYALALAGFITELLKIKRLDKSEVKKILED